MEFTLPQVAISMTFLRIICRHKFADRDSRYEDMMSIDIIVL